MGGCCPCSTCNSAGSLPWATAGTATGAGGEGTAAAAAALVAAGILPVGVAAATEAAGAGAAAPFFSLSSFPFTTAAASPAAAAEPCFRAETGERMLATPAGAAEPFEVLLLTASAAAPLARGAALLSTASGPSLGLGRRTGRGPSCRAASVADTAGKAEAKGRGERAGEPALAWAERMPAGRMRAGAAAAFSLCSRPGEKREAVRVAPAPAVLGLPAAMSLWAEC